MAASPTIGDVKTLNKLTRQLKSQSVILQLWSLKGPLRIVGFPDVSNKNKQVAFSQRHDNVLNGIA